MIEAPELKKLKEVLAFSYTNDSDELYHPRHIKIFDNAEMTGEEIAKKIKEMLPDMPTNLYYFHDEIEKIASNYVFVVCADLIEAARIANRSTLRMDYMNIVNNYIVMIFDKTSNQIEVVEIVADSLPGDVLV